MLQRTDMFMPAKVLGVTKKQRTALVAVLGILERGEIEHSGPVKFNSWNLPVIDKGPGKYFNMQFWKEMGIWKKNYRECNTIFCIGGLAEDIAGVKFNKRLHDLFYPDFYLQTITVKQAAQALRNYLTHGNAGWAGILGF
jgi:hypothetical protein